MGRYRSNITWFNDGEFVGSEVTILMGQKNSRWKLEQKISENEFCETEDSGDSEARAVFLCTNVDGSSTVKEAIIKIRMQILWRFTTQEPLHIRAKQATETLSCLANNEIESLDTLTKAGCTSTPTLFAWKQDKQNALSWVPSGYIVYILMEKLPGVSLNLKMFYQDMDRKERDDIRENFKLSWLECKSCGIINVGCGIRNLWDKEKKKCYILDFEIVRIADERDIGVAEDIYRGVWHTWTKVMEEISMICLLGYYEKICVPVFVEVISLMEDGFYIL